MSSLHRGIGVHVLAEEKKQEARLSLRTAYIVTDDRLRAVDRSVNQNTDVVQRQKMPDHGIFLLQHGIGRRSENSAKIGQLRTGMLSLALVLSCP